MKNIKKWCSKGFSIILWAVGLIGLFASIVLNFSPLVNTCSSIFASLGLKDTCQSLAHLLGYETWVSEKPFQQLSSLVLSAAVLIAMLTYGREKKRSRSEFFLKRASDGVDAVYDLLRDQNNDRVIWLRAARTLLEARKLAKEIELEEYQRAYRLHEEQVRHNLYFALSIDDENTDQRNSLPPQFFFGSKDWEKQVRDGKTLDELAIEASPPPKTYRSDINVVPQLPPLTPLAEKSVCTIFDFLDYPEDYKDPLDDVQVWGADYWNVAFSPKIGAAQYIHHRATKYAVGGKLFDRNSKDNPPA